VPVLERLLTRRQVGIDAEQARAGRRAYRAQLAEQAGGKPRGLNCPPEEQWARVVNSEVGGYLSYGLWRRHLDAARAASGVGYSAHELRHVCVSLLVAAGTHDAGMDIKEVVRRHIGHSSYKTTERVYRHLFNVDHRELARRLSAGVAVVTASEIVEAEAANAAAAVAFAS
jgi:integrase